MKSIEQILEENNLILIHEESNYHEEWYIFNPITKSNKLTIKKTYKELERYIFKVYEGIDKL